MARVTRSNKIIIAEDNAVFSSQDAMPEPLFTTRAPLEEINTNTDEVITMEAVDTANEIKDLKAAFKTATVGKKSKKGKSKKKNQKQPVVEEQVVNDAVITESDASDAVRQLLNIMDGGGLANLLNGMNGLEVAKSEDKSLASDMPHAPMSPAVREAREQLSNAQTGQYKSKVPLGAYRSGFHPGHFSFGAAINSPSYGRSIENWIANQYETPKRPLADRYVPPAKRNADYVQANQGQKMYVGEDVEMLEAPKTPMKTPLKTPMKTPRTLAEVEADCERSESPNLENNHPEDDSFVQVIVMRSPAKPVTRIEDSVEALDKLEDALEALDDVKLTKELESPEKKQKRPAMNHKMGISAARSPTDTLLKARNTAVGKPTASSAGALKKAKSAPSFGDTVRPGISTMRPPVPTLKPLLERKSTTFNRPASLMPPKQAEKSTRAPTLPSFELPGEAVARKLKEQREARKAQREALAAEAAKPKPRSARPPTRPTFELPGEAISRRKREAHEARLKAQEEEERIRREFKAKPVRTSITPNMIPRDTIASLARKSLVFTDAENGLELNVAKRHSLLGRSVRSSMSATNLANVSAPRAPVPAPIPRKVSTTSGPSMSGLAMQRTVSSSDLEYQRQRGRGIYQREARMLEEQEKERHEREAAAKKSREEAAERGRQASREWAEKQRAKKAADGDEGLSAAYGPGGQLGLKA